MLLRTNVKKCLKQQDLPPLLSLLSPSLSDLLAPITAFVFAASLQHNTELGEQKEENIQCRSEQQKKKKPKHIMALKVSKCPAEIGHPLSASIFLPPPIRIREMWVNTPYISLGVCSHLFFLFFFFIFEFHIHSNTCFYNFSIAYWRM